MSLLRRLVADETNGEANVELLQHESLAEAIARRSGDHDLLVIGLQQLDGRKLLGTATRQVLDATTCPALIISSGR